MLRPGEAEGEEVILLDSDSPALCGDSQFLSHPGWDCSWEGGWGLRCRAAVWKMSSPFLWCVTVWPRMSILEDAGRAWSWPASSSSLFHHLQGTGTGFAGTAPVPAPLFLTWRGKDPWGSGCMRKCGVSHAGRRLQESK